MSMDNKKPSAKSAKNQEQDQSPALLAWKAKNEKLAQIDLRKTLEALGALPNQDRDKNKWKVLGVGNILTKGQAWKNGNLEVSGWGSVKLVQHAMNFEKETEAMTWLAEQFPEELEGNWREEIEQSIKAKKGKKNESDDKESGFSPPERFDEFLDDVRVYLIGRGLPAQLVEREIKEGRLYATKMVDEKTGEPYGDTRCVFIGPANAEIRSTDPKGFKGCAKGSDTEKSGYQVMFTPPHEPVLAITEAAVDALSYQVLHPHRFVISTNGAGRFELQIKLTLEAYRNGFETLWAFDADVAGDVAAQRLFNALLMREKLCQQFGASQEEIDEWIVTQKLVSLPEFSPHQLFLAKRETDDLPIYQGERDDTDPENPRIKYVDTGEKSPAQVSWKFLKAAGGRKRGESGVIVVTQNDLDEIEKKYRVRYDRPEGKKDWNEILIGTELGKKMRAQYGKDGKDAQSTPKAEPKVNSKPSAEKNDGKIDGGTADLAKPSASSSVSAEKASDEKASTGTTPKPTGRFVRKPVK